MAGFPPAPALPTRVYVTDNVVQSCVAHALTTEGEEIIGFCLGWRGEQCAYVWDTCVRPRSDKRSDRCEVAPEDQIAAAEEAEALTQRGLKTKVVGWYHSHPHITCPPSHVDLRTQGHLQAMGLGVGLIFSVFNNANEPRDGFGETQVLSRVQVHCFQTGPGESPISVPVHVVPVIAATEMAHGAPVSMSLLPASGFARTRQILTTLVEEEKEAYSKQSTDDEGTLLHAASVYCKTLCNIEVGYVAPLTEQLGYEKKCADVAVRDATINGSTAEFERLQRHLAAANAELAKLEAEYKELADIHRRTDQVVEELLTATQAQRVQQAMITNPFFFLE